MTGKSSDKGDLVGPHAASAPRADRASAGGERDQGDGDPGGQALELAGRRVSAGAPGGTIARALPDGAAAAEKLAPKRGRGRPKGSRNLRTEQVARALVESYGDPLEADVAIGAMPPGELVTLLRTVASDRGIKLGMTLADVLRLQRDCRSAALPYIHAKRASVDEQGETVTPVIAFGTFQVGEAGGARSLEDVIEGEIEDVENQEVSEAPKQKSDGEKSDGEPNT